MEVRSVTNPGQAGGGGGASSTVQSANPPVPSVVTPNNHVSKIKAQVAPRRKRPGKVKTTLPIVKSKDQCDKHSDEVVQFSVV